MLTREHPHRAGTWDWITFLVTGPERNLGHFTCYAPVEILDRRGHTLRCRANDYMGDRGQKNYETALSAAYGCDVTFQDLVDTGRRENAQTHMLGGDATVTCSDVVEEYPVVHLGSHKMKWPPEKRENDPR